MGRVAIGYNNLIDVSSLSGGSWLSSYPLSKLQDRELGQQARASSTANTSSRFIADHGSAVDVGVVLLAAHNVTDASATVRVLRGTSSGGAEVYDTTALAAWPFTPLVGSRDGARYPLVVVLPATAGAARYTTVIVDVAGGAAARVGRPFIGPLFRPTYNPVSLVDGYREPNSELARMANGADWPLRRAEQRSPALVFGALTHAEGRLLDEIIYTHTVTDEVVYVPDTTDRAEQQRRGVLGTLRQLGALEYPIWRHNGVAVSVDERGGTP